MIPTGNPAANGENKHQPAVSGKIGLLVPTVEDEFYEQNPEEQIWMKFTDNSLWGKR